MATDQGIAHVITMDALVNLDRNEHLDLAEALMNAVKESFTDDSEFICDHCGMKTQRHWIDFQAREFASLTINRIQRIRGLVKTGQAKEQEDAANS